MAVDRNEWQKLRFGDDLWGGEYHGGYFFKPKCFTCRNSQRFVQRYVRTCRQCEEYVSDAGGDLFLQGNQSCNKPAFRGYRFCHFGYPLIRSCRWYGLFRWWKYSDYPGSLLEPEPVAGIFG